MSDYSKHDLKEALRKSGITEGDSVFTHSNVGFFGRLENAKTPQDYYSVFKEVVLELIGPSGTWIQPTFSYSFCWGNDFDVDHTPGICGALTEFMRNDSDSIRSNDPNFSVAAVGGSAKHFTENPSKHSFGRDCLWERLLQKKAWVVNFNRDAASTMVHYVERELGVPYRFDKPFSGTYVLNGARVAETFFHFVSDKDKPEHSPELSKFDSVAKGKGLSRYVNLGKGQIVSITAEDTINLIREQIQIDPQFLIKGTDSQL